jgi:DNA-binding NtrC family response regulator
MQNESYIMLELRQQELTEYILPSEMNDTDNKLKYGKTEVEMDDKKILEGKKLLIVDDEPDVTETLKDLLDMCAIDTAADFQTAEKLLNQNKYDVAVLDIMGVKGYDLLEIANKKGVPALMLTAHALSPEDFGKSISGGAKAYIPKEKMTEIAVFVADVLKAQQGDEKPYKWFTRLKSFFEWKFGKEWLQTYREVRAEAERRYGPFPND